jgi:ubiquinone/menaquinone biosynthesis C-methylase UbiE
MAHEICPWWLGYWLASPVRKLLHDPGAILAPFIREGMTVFEPGPGMGFFTLEIARMVGQSGRVVAVDIQPKMLETLGRKARRKGLGGRVERRLADSNGMGVRDLAGKVDFVLAFAVVHEVPDATNFFKESLAVLRPGGTLLFSEPSNHVAQADFEGSLASARKAGFKVESGPTIRSNRTAVLRRMS